MGLHAGINQNFLVIKDHDEDQNLFMGFDMEFNPELSMIVEYNAALNENDNEAEDIALNKLFIKRNLSKMQRVLFSKKLMQYTIQRLHFLKIESLIDKIYRLSSWYTIKNIKNDKTLFMIQRLPTSTIERYKRFNLNNK